MRCERLEQPQIALFLYFALVYDWQKKQISRRTAPGIYTNGQTHS